jgi:hypothetical protein
MGTTICLAIQLIVGLESEPIIHCSFPKHLSVTCRLRKSPLLQHVKGVTLEAPHSSILNNVLYNLLIAVPDPGNPRSMK